MDRGAYSPQGHKESDTTEVTEHILISIQSNLLLEKEMATHSSIFAWKIPWTEEPGGLQSRGLQSVGHNRATRQTQHTNFLKGVQK